MSETTTAFETYADVRARACQSQGGSDDAIYRMVAGVLAEHQSGGTIVDVGCGVGNLWPFVHQQFKDYIGVDVVRYEYFPSDAQFIQVDLNQGMLPLPSNTVDVLVAVETIEHLENPRFLVREMVRLAKPGGWVIVTTPNQLSLLSLLTLVVKRRFSAFQDVHYPAHLTALLEVDLMRIAAECGLSDVAIIYSKDGRIVLTPWHYPRFVARIFPRALSDNLLLIGRKPYG
jgi:2-polyprenyl-3-methyl-5-hydroxy-6-metoxy-1,4-benzoquinol methylase